MKNESNIFKQFKDISNKSAELIQSLKEEDLQAFVGADYYKFASIKNNSNNKKLFWSWPAFFLSGIWAGYRKDWQQVFVACLIILCFGFLGFLFCAILYGCAAKRNYILHCASKINEIKIHETDPFRFNLALKAAGGVSMVSGFISFLLILSALISSLLLANLFVSWL